MGPRFSVALCFAAFVLFPTRIGAAPAQESSAKSAVPTTTSAKVSENDSNSSEAYVFDLIQTRIAFEADGKGYRDLVARVSIKSESAVREFGLLTYPFASSFESLEVVYARVRKPDGSVVETPASDIQELDSAVSREAPMYTDQREKHIAIKSFSAGDVLELHIRWTIHDPIAPGHFWFDHNFFREGVCLKETLEIDVPRDLPVRLRNSDPQPSVRDDGARRVYTFENVNLKKREESKTPAWEKNYRGIPPPDVQVSSFSSWKEAGDWFDALAKPKAAVTAEIRSKAEELTKGKTTDEEKIRALYDFVSSRFRYIGIDLGLSRYTPHSAAEVLVNRYGDCKDKHTLFAALLQAVNVAAYPVLISSSYRIDPSFPSPSLFDHVITAIPQGESFVFLDTTSEVAPFGLLVRNLRDRQGLAVLPSQSTRLIATPANPPFPTYEVFHIDSSIDTKGTLDAKMRLEERGDGELGLRFAYRSTPQNNWQELTQKIVAAMGFGGTVSDVSVEQPEDTAQPFWISFTYHRTDFPDWKNYRIVLPAPPIFIQELNEEQKLSKDSLPLGSPQEVTYETTVKFPKGFSPLLPQKVERKYDFAEFSATYSLKEDTLHGTLHFKTMLNEIPGMDRSKFSSLAKAIQDTESSYIFLKGDFPGAGVIGGAIPPVMLFGNSTAAIPQLEQVLETDPDNDAVLAQLSNLYCQAGRASDAVALLKKSMDAHPDVPEHLHVALGKAYLRIPDVEKAMPEFKQGLADGAEPKELNEVAYALAEANVHLSDALEYSGRAVKALSDKTMDIAPEDAGPSDFSLMLQLAANWDTLGWIKFRAGDYPGAEKYLQAGWEIVQDAVIGEHLAETYEKLGKKEKAAAVCNMALSSYLPGDPATHQKLSDGMTRLRPFLTSTSGLSGASRSAHSVDGGVALSDMRDLQVPFRTKLQANFVTGNFLISVSNGSKGNDAVFLSGAEELRGAIAALAALKYPQSFPDDTPTRVIRKAVLSCSIYSKNCTLVLMLPTDAAVPVPFRVPAPTNPG
jgi:tetratricopeptide (TPR) repeat protein